MSEGEGEGVGPSRGHVSIYVPTSSYTRKSLSGIPSSTLLSRFLHLLYALHACHSLWGVKSQKMLIILCFLLIYSARGCACSVIQSCPSLCDPMDCSPSGSSVHGILQARILEWAAISSPGELPNPGIRPKSLTSSALTGEFFTTSAT